MTVCKVMTFFFCPLFFSKFSLFFIPFGCHPLNRVTRGGRVRPLPNDATVMYYLTFEGNSSMTSKRNSLGDRLIKTSECACICTRRTLKRLSVSYHSWNNGAGMKCNRSIVSVVIVEWSEVFLRWQIRLFTFMVGREVGKVKHIQWMACSYHGTRCFHPRLQQSYLCILDWMA